MEHHSLFITEEKKTFGEAVCALEGQDQGPGMAVMQLQRSHMQEPQLKAAPK